MATASRPGRASLLHLFLGSLAQATWTSLRILARNRMGFLGFLTLVFFVLMSFVGPYFIPLDTRTKIDRIYEPPSARHWLGTDHQGRDILSQIVNGGKDILYVGFLAALISTLISVTFGALAAFIGGRFESFVVTTTDIVLTIPPFPLLAVLAGLVRLHSPIAIAILLALLSWPVLLRAVRAQVLSLKERDYVEAARALDLGTRHIIFAEILPNMMGYIAIMFILGMTSAIYSMAGLILLGLVPLSSSNWAVMINLAWVRGAIFFQDSIWYIMMPILAIALLQFAAISFSRSLEAVFNPRLRVGD